MSIFAVEYVYGPEAEAERTEHRPAHRAWLVEQAAADVVLASGPYGDGAGALLIFQAPDEATLNEILKQDPMNLGGGVTGLKVSAWKPVIGQFSKYMS
ncbi:hypothetical protein AOC05_03695 [Arthrobacter alpinus]|uniref:YCII-related domain-containing protein n=1 Tax=Arthrobacter alpinus TaxID=656366 RepID=A0A0M4QVB3_9MICC|nr:MULTISPECIES: YciI family protein [Arthrobacter]ALE91648.1 hypothetical protein AOC05_03695 [Arthrobacter alpinus]